MQSNVASVACVRPRPRPNMFLHTCLHTQTGEREHVGAARLFGDSRSRRRSEGSDATV